MPRARKDRFVRNFGRVATTRRERATRALCPLAVALLIPERDERIDAARARDRIASDHLPEIREFGQRLPPLIREFVEAMRNLLTHG